ncbi:MAG: patatin-like phospholipase family protein [Tissierellia bacterium]|nr:patatin-like phospholipase family protein [Tissierellia bacterium]
MYGLVLEGGGAKGAYHIGAYRALMEEGIEIQGIAGTSVGALNGAILAQGDYEKAYELWYNMSYSKVINATDEEIEKLKAGKLSKEDLSLVAERIKGVISEGGLDITPLRNLVMEVIDEEKVRNSGKDFGIVTVSLSDLKPLEIYIEDIPNGELREYLLASAYFPAFKREKIGGKRYVDGGIYNNLPVNLLKNKGYKDLILIRTHGLGYIKKVDLENLNTIIISPNEELCRTLDFERDSARYNLTLGYYDGMKALKDLKGFHYYIEPTKDGDYFTDYLWNLEEEKILKLKKVFKIDENIPNRKAMFEFINPKLSSLLGVEKQDEYEEIFYTLVEKLAEIYGMERFKIYKYDELVNLVMEKIKLEEEKDTGILDKIIDKVDVLSFFTREETIKEVGQILL